MGNSNTKPVGIHLLNEHYLTPFREMIIDLNKLTSDDEKVTDDAAMRMRSSYIHKVCIKITIIQDACFDEKTNLVSDCSMKVFMIKLTDSCNNVKSEIKSLTKYVESLSNSNDITMNTCLHIPDNTNCCMKYCIPCLVNIYTCCTLNTSSSDKPTESNHVKSVLSKDAMLAKICTFMFQL